MRNMRLQGGLSRSKELGIQSCCTVQGIVKRTGAIESPPSRTGRAQS